MRKVSSMKPRSSSHIIAPPEHLRSRTQPTRRSARPCLSLTLSDRVATSELHAAFASHGVKAGYLQRSVRVDLDRASGWPGEGTIEYSVDSVGFRKRTAAMYVDFGTEYAPCIPDTAISTEDASARINLVDSHLHDISMAEYNGEQIGTYGLWK